jgi:hypothetical protein
MSSPGVLFLKNSGEQLITPIPLWNRWNGCNKQFIFKYFMCFRCTIKAFGVLLWLFKVVQICLGGANYHAPWRDFTGAMAPLRSEGLPKPSWSNFSGSLQEDSFQCQWWCLSKMVTMMTVIWGCRCEIVIIMRKQKGQKRSINSLIISG